MHIASAADRGIIRELSYGRQAQLAYFSLRGSRVEFKDKLKSLREQKGWTQQQLAEASGLGQRSVSNLEQGRNKPTWESVLALARALGVSCEDFAADANA